MMIHLLLSLILSIEIIVMTDFIMVLRGIHFKLSLYGLSMLSLFVLLAFVVKASSGIMLAAIMTILMIPCLMYLLWLPFARSSRDFEDVDNGKAECYGGKKVMLIVPHQDDEINVLGGVLEEYLKYGSEVYIVYPATNGMTGGVRYTEALSLCKRIGIPEENVIFLGYGFVQGIENPVCPITKGIKENPAYKEGQPCCRANMVNDMKEIILCHRPDIIYGSDYDRHPVHRLVTIALDEAIGQILQKQNAYRPIVCKGYAYRTTWESYPDYYETNIRSTKYMKAAVETYPWEERLRLPIAAHVLNRSLLHSEIFQQYKVFKSMGAIMRAINFNTDKVVWQRRTDSLLLNAKVEVSSGNGDRLKDFLLYDEAEPHMLAIDYTPTDGVWIADKGDKEKEVKFMLQKVSDIKYLTIYQNQEPDSLIETVSISFNNESPRMYSLRADGYPTCLFVNEKNVRTFVLKIVQSHGENAGLTEIEAFKNNLEPPFGYIKLMNRTGDFLYDYWVDRSGKESFVLYGRGNVKPLSAENYYISVDNPRCSCFIDKSEIKICCPKNETTKLRIESNGNKYSDTIVISNPDNKKRLLYKMGQTLEKIYYDIFIGDYHRKATTLSIWAIVKRHTIF